MKSKSKNVCKSSHIYGVKSISIFLEHVEEQVCELCFKSYINLVSD